MASLTMGQVRRTQFSIPSSDLPSNVAKDQLSQDAGNVIDFGVSVQVTITTGGTLTLTAVDNTGTVRTIGVITIPNGATKGTFFSALAQYNAANASAANQAPPTSLPYAGAGPAGGIAQFPRNTRLLITPAGFATAGAVEGYVDIASP